MSVICNIYNMFYYLFTYLFFFRCYEKFWLVFSQFCFYKMLDFARTCILIIKTRSIIKGKKSFEIVFFFVESTLYKNQLTYFSVSSKNHFHKAPLRFSLCSWYSDNMDLPGSGGFLGTGSCESCLFL